MKIDVGYGEKKIREFARDILMETGGLVTEANLNHISSILAQMTSYAVNLSVDKLVEGGFLIDTGLREEIDVDELDDCI